MPRAASSLCVPFFQLFHVAYVLIKFANSPRPDLWVLERSTDFGLTYEPWQYFACEYASVTRELQLSAGWRGCSEGGSLRK